MHDSRWRICMEGLAGWWPSKVQNSSGRGRGRVRVRVRVNSTCIAHLVLIGLGEKLRSEDEKEHMKARRQWQTQRY